MNHVTHAFAPPQNQARGLFLSTSFTISRTSGSRGIALSKKMQVLSAKMSRELLLNLVYILWKLSIRRD